MKLKEIKSKLKIKNTWFAISAVLLVLLMVSIFTNGFDSIFGGSANKIGKDAVEFVSNNLLGPGQTASLVKADCDRGVDICKINFDLSGRNINAYVSSDGKLFFPESIDVEKTKNSNKTEEVPLSEKPEANLFVMTYCPFGLQSQKAMLPVMDLLKEEADIKMNFVDYAMHDKQELDENLKQYCLQDEDYNQYIDYLNCFVVDGNSEKCLREAGVNNTKLNTCIENLDKEYKVTENYSNKDTWKGNYPSFLVEADLNEKYQVGGSPTLIINGVEVSADRIPEAYKNVICNAFTEAPEECETTLSEEPISSGFGFNEVENNSTGGCN